MDGANVLRNPLEPCYCGKFGRHRGAYDRAGCFIRDFDIAKTSADGLNETLESSVAFFKSVKTHCAEVDRELGDAEASFAELAKALRAAEQRRERARAGVRAVRQLLDQASAQCSRACRGAAVAATQLIDAEAEYAGVLPGVYAPADVPVIRDAATASVNARLRTTRIGVQRWSDLGGDGLDRAAALAVLASFSAAVGRTRLAEVMHGNMNAQARPQPAPAQQVATQQTNQQAPTKKKGKNNKKKRNNNRSEPYARPESYARPANRGQAVRGVAPVQPKTEEPDEGNGCNVDTSIVQSVAHLNGATSHQARDNAVNLDYEQPVEHGDDSGYHDHEYAQEHKEQAENDNEGAYEDDRMNDHHKVVNEGFEEDDSEPVDVYDEECDDEVEQYEQEDDQEEEESGQGDYEEDDEKDEENEDDGDTFRPLYSLRDVYYSQPCRQWRDF
ncbi:hypothetical protein CSOJ01_07306 [Colletotrichum sojae]|uniref:Uncharacterized protein n=1 Tax=Colletotrichum sojae TaxID=2175907 RepID=A0A8H6J9X0_9PEZI|nr:hypothetical protein CSOJ01_07306 [Colletotrichum sojae]